MGRDQTKLMKKSLLAFGVLFAVAAGIVGMSAFEAHVINVTARIENALNVPVDEIRFGTVFPQEQLDRKVEIGLSRSFIAEDRVDDVRYIIRQKPKCAITSKEGTAIDFDSTATGHVVVDEKGETSINCGEPPRRLEEGERWGVLPSLCEYLSKHKVDSEEQKEVELDAFHKPYVVDKDDTGKPVIRWIEASGYLSKLAQDTIDTWNIDLKVPCFGDYCAQDWAKFVHDINPEADPNEYTQPISNEHKIFGCDLWIEVTDINEATPID